MFKPRRVKPYCPQLDQDTRLKLEEMLLENRRIYRLLVEKYDLDNSPLVAEALDEWLRKKKCREIMDKKKKEEKLPQKTKKKKVLDEPIEEKPEDNLENQTYGTEVGKDEEKDTYETEMDEKQDKKLEDDLDKETAGMEMGEEKEEKKDEDRDVHVRLVHGAESASDITEVFENRIKNRVKIFYKSPTYLPINDNFLNKYYKQSGYFCRKANEDSNFAVRFMAPMHYTVPKNISMYKRLKGAVLEKLYQPANLLGINGLAFSKNGKFFAFGLGAGMIKICDIEKRTIETSKPKENIPKILCLRSSPIDEYTFVCSTIGGNILISKFEDPTWNFSEFTTEVNNEINCIALNSNGRLLVTGGKDSNLRVYNFEKTKLLNIYRGYNLNTLKIDLMTRLNLEEVNDGHFSRIYATKFRDNNTFLSGEAENTVKMWDLRVRNKPVLNICGPRILGDAVDVMDNLVLTGQWTAQNSVELWDIRTSGRISVFSPKNRSEYAGSEFTNCCRFVRNWGKFKMNIAHGDLIIVGGSGFEALEVQSFMFNKILHSFHEPSAITIIEQYDDMIAYCTTNNEVCLLAYYPDAFYDETMFRNWYEYVKEVADDANIKEKCFLK